ncbi:MAG: nitroreductase family protein [Candidatus Omnitrophica bacterium]|nr:nitroreductase family protein [Candidatus Omnitrophota bacterium]
MDFFDVISKRTSVREYSEKEISRESIEKIINAGRLAATARNVQPWRFVVVTGKERIQQLAKLVSPNGAFMIGASAAIVVLSVDTKYYIEDCSAATENILLAATALDIGTCWIAGDKKDYSTEVASFAQAEGDERLVSVIALGYPAKPVEPKEKQKLSELIKWL